MKKIIPAEKQSFVSLVHNPKISYDSVKHAIKAMREGIIDSFSISLCEYRILNGVIANNNQYDVIVRIDEESDLFVVVGDIIINGVQKEISAKVEADYCASGILCSDFHIGLKDFCDELDYMLDTEISNWYISYIKDFDTTVATDFFEKVVHFFPHKFF